MLAVYLVPFGGELLEATITNDASIIEYWLKRNVVESSSETRRKVIGLHCKWGLHPMATASSSQTHKISTIQFCFRTKCLILQLSHMKRNVVLQTLKGFLSDANNVFVGTEVEELASAMEREHGLRCNDTSFDVREVAKRIYPFSFGGRSIVGLKTLACRLVNLRPWKPFKAFATESFESAKLDKEQVKSVCVDVYVLYRIGIKLLNQI